MLAEANDTNKQLKTRLEALESKTGTDTQPADEVSITEYTAVVRFIDDLPVVAYGRAFDKIVEGRKATLIKVGILNADGTIKEQTEDHTRLLNETQMYQAKIIKTDRKTMRRDQSGKSTAFVAEPADPYHLHQKKQVVVTRRVQAKEEYDVLTSTVEMIEGPMEGKVITLNSEALNRR